MSGRIRVLDENVINRIAAGEVVERPASVVKELIENAIDARASSIRIDIENGGKKLIRVRDNGTGMSRDDSFLALERHATSKLRSEKDLVGIATMGFRGEALASIASVSRLKLLTNDESEEAGTEIVIEGGTLRKSDRVGMGRGTIVEVRNLFFNVPVRRKFLKGTPVEAGHVQELMTRVALAFPSMGLTYTEDGKVKIDVPEVSTTFERIYGLYSKDVRENLVEIDYSLEGVHVSGYVAKPPYARSNMRSVLTFVNGRSVRDRLVNTAVTRAFSNLMERGRYPLAILFIELPPEHVDVNVHPQKTEVRFVKPERVFNAILDGVYAALTGAPFKAPAGPREPIFPQAPYASVSRHLRDEEDRSGVFPTLTAIPELGRAEAVIPPAESFAFPTESTGRFSSLGILGRVPGSFLVLHDDQDLIVMDHHAAHERVLFEDFLQHDREGIGFETQELLIPRILEYSATEARALASHRELLRKVGFLLEEFGDKDFAVKGVPGWLKNEDVEGFFAELVSVMLDTGLRGDPNRLKEELFKSMACRAAAKESTSMHSEEIRGLLKDLDRTGSAEVCPHGRPFTVRLPLSEIRRKMGRK
jgi:DNA mismatch repair protein MutL